LVRLKVDPDPGEAGDSVPEVTAPFSTTFPTGVPGQYSS
jgi:hypothetical protein